MAALALAVAGVPTATAAQAPPAVPVAQAAVTYADAVGLVEPAAIVALVDVRDQVAVEPERAPGLAPGHARLYITARTAALLAGGSAIGESLTFLADVPLDAKGKPPKLKKQRVLIFADPVAGRPGTLQLVEPRAMLATDPATEQLVRKVIAALAEPGAPPRITGVRDVMSVPGNLVGESETQLFLDTASGVPVSLTVVRRPGMAAEWGVSWSEIVDQSARPPAPETVEWYRLTCSLPGQLPSDAFLQQDRSSRARAEADYRFILDQLGECSRTRA
jgi:hypothetical protein